MIRKDAAIAALLVTGIALGTFVFRHTARARVPDAQDAQTVSHLAASLPILRNVVSQVQAITRAIDSQLVDLQGRLTTLRTAPTTTATELDAAYSQLRIYKEEYEVRQGQVRAVVEARTASAQILTVIAQKLTALTTSLAGTAKRPL